MGVLGSGENGVKNLGSREHGDKKTWEQGGKESILGSREQRILVISSNNFTFREHRKLIWGAVIKKTRGAGSRGLNFEGSGGPPPCRASVVENFIPASMV